MWSDDNKPEGHYKHGSSTAHYHQFIDSGTSKYILSSGASFIGSPEKVNYDGIFISGLNRGLGDHNYGSIALISST